MLAIHSDSASQFSSSFPCPVKILPFKFVIGDSIYELPSIDPFHDIDPMLGDESESSNRHLLALCDVTAEEFELLCGKKLGPENDDAVTDDETDSEWEEAEL